MALPFWRMAPMPVIMQGEGLCLAYPGEVYVAYLPHGGPIGLDLPSPEREFTARWFDPRAGQFHGSRNPVRQQEFHAPDGEDWVLLLERQAPA
jgi:hypothetical protein